MSEALALLNCFTEGEFFVVAAYGGCSRFSIRSGGSSCAGSASTSSLVSCHTGGGNVAAFFSSLECVLLPGLEPTTKSGMVRHCGKPAIDLLVVGLTLGIKFTGFMSSAASLGDEKVAVTVAVGLLTASVGRV